MDLIIYPPAFGAPSASPFCVKALCLLEMSGAVYKIKVTLDPRKSPTKKLPVLLDGDQIIPDSDAIREHLEQKLSFDFDAGLDPGQRAVSRAFIRMAEEHLYFIAIRERWLDDDNWPAVRRAFFGAVPALLRGIVTRSVRNTVRKQLYFQGTGRLSIADQMARGDKDLTAIAAQIGGNQFMFADTPSAADASVAPMLAAIAGSPSATLLAKRVRSDTALMAYLERCRGAIFPAKRG